MTSEASEDLSNAKQGIVRQKFHLYVELCENSMKIETHMKRLSNLRKELTYIKNTDWKYDPVEKQVGQS